MYTHDTTISVKKVDKSECTRTHCLRKEVRVVRNEKMKMTPSKVRT